MDCFFCNGNETFYFDSFGFEHVPKEIKKSIGNKNIKGNIFREQANNLVMCEYFCIGFIDFMLAGKKMTDFTNIIFKMNEINKTNLTDQTKFRLEKITEIQNVFHKEINRRKLCSKKLNKHDAAFDYIDKVLIVLSATSGGVCIISSASILGAPIGIAGEGFTLICFF